MLIIPKGHTDTIQVYSVTVMTHVKALQAGHSSQGTSEPITPGPQLVVEPPAQGCSPSVEHTQTDLTGTLHVDDRSSFNGAALLGVATCRPSDA